MRRSAFDVVAGVIESAQVATQEAIASNTPLPTAETMPIRRNNTGSKLAGAGVATLAFLVFFVGLAWVLGRLTGEALFRTVEQAAS